MRRLLIALRAFCVALWRGEVAAELERVLDQAKLARRAKVEVEKPRKVEPPKPRAAPRSDAVTLLATLQREARFVDFTKEPLSGYSDAQIGAVARDVHRDCGQVLDRLFAIRPIAADEEGSAVEVPAGFDAGRYRLTGDVTGEPPFRGRLRHHGWEVTTCDLPSWSGSDASVRTVAPVEVELEQPETTP